MLGIPACLPLLALGRIVSRFGLDTTRTPLADRSILLTLLGALSVLVFAVRRWHAPLEPPPARPARTAAEVRS